MLMNRALRQLRIAAAESPNRVRPTGPADPMRSPVYPAKHDSRRWAPNAIGLGALLGIGALAGWLITDHLALFALLGVGGLTIISIIASAHGETHAAASNMTNIGTVSLDSALRSLAAIAEERDRELAGHSERVAENSVRIGQELGLSSNELHKLWWAGLLHDLGKIGVAESILNKPGPLNDVELVEVQKHPDYGASILSAFGGDVADISKAVRFHHEKWNGSGYPLGIVGDAIPLSARVLAVADVFEALTSRRAYRSALTPEQAAIYILRESGQHFDPSVVKAFDVCFRAGVLLFASQVPPLTGAAHNSSVVSAGLSIDNLYQSSRHL